MTTPLKTLQIVSWLTFLLCTPVVLFIAISAANTVMMAGPEARDESVRTIESSTDLRYVQQRAVALIKGAAFTSRLSMFLCRLAVVTMLLVMVGAGISLIQIRRLRKQLNEPTRS
jgi:hypothetical protein